MYSSPGVAGRGAQIIYAGQRPPATLPTTLPTRAQLLRVCWRPAVQLQRRHLGAMRLGEPSIPDGPDSRGRCHGIWRR